MMYKILLMGPQGSGKGTQAELLSKELQIPAFAMGQLLRDEIAVASDIGKKVASILSAGNLVSDEDAAEVLKGRLERGDTKGGYILDGYPRNVSQYAAFNFDTPTHVLVIELPKEESMKRLSGRLTCGACGKVGNVSDGLKIGDACSCGGTWFQRNDDRPEAIEKRLAIYETQTRPVINLYEAQGVVQHIEGMGTVDEIHQRIIDSIRSYGTTKN